MHAPIRLLARELPAVRIDDDDLPVSREPILYAELDERVHALPRKLQRCVIRPGQIICNHCQAQHAITFLPVLSLLYSRKNRANWRDAILTYFLHTKKAGLLQKGTYCIFLQQACNNFFVMRYGLSRFSLFLIFRQSVVR